MLKASALYIVIIVSLIIAVFSASLISTAYFYRLGYQKNQRFNKLLLNINSATNILLSKDFHESTHLVTDLFGDGADSVILSKEQWGAFGLATMEVFDHADTLKRAFLIGESSQKDQTAIYLSDEDRPLCVSGDTRISGEVFLPKAGIKQAFVESKPYTGSSLVAGLIKTSGRKIPLPGQDWLSFMQNKLAYVKEAVEQSVPDSLKNSFFNPEMNIRVRESLNGQRISGKIALYSDTLLRIGRDTKLNDVIIYAKSIVVEAGFRGNCQLFAQDSVNVGTGCVFTYPSCIAVLKPDTSKLQTLIRIGANTEFSGILISYEKNRGEVQTMLSIGKNSVLTGEAYSSGFIKLEKPLIVNGKLSCNRFIMQTPATFYENYLIDITVNRPTRSRYYLTAKCLQPGTADSRVLKWLN